MSEEAPSPGSRPVVSKQSLITGFVLGGTILLLCVFVFTLGKSPAGNSELKELGEKVTRLRAQNSATRQRLGLSPLLEGNTASAETLASRIDADAGQLAALVKSIQADVLNKHNELTSLRSLNASHAKRLQDLEARASRFRAAAAQAEAYRQQAASLNQRVSMLNGQLAKAVAPSTLAKLRQRLAETVRQRDSYEDQLRALRKKAGAIVSAGDLDELRSKNKSLDAANNKLRHELQKLRAHLGKELFVESSGLDPRARKLFAKLASIEGTGSDARIRKYVAINEEFRSSVIGAISFQTNSSKVAFDKVERVRQALQAASPDSFFLVVGYASKTGTLAANRKLSSQRATTIAGEVNAMKKAGQGLQAVFLGQTDRFSKTDPMRNQICEIWEIRK